MFVRKIKSNKGIIEVGKYGVDRIDAHDDGTATYYTAGGNIFTVKVKEVLNADGIVSNSRNHHKNLYWPCGEKGCCFATSFFLGLLSLSYSILETKGINIKINLSRKRLWKSRN